MTDEKPARRGYRPPLTGVLCAGAAALTVVGSFLPLFSANVKLGFPTVVLTTTITSWGSSATANGLPDADPRIGVPPDGVPLLIAAALLLIAVVVTVRSGAGWQRVAAATAGAAFLAGAVATVCVQESVWLHDYGPSAISPVVRDVAVDLTIDVGFWLLIAAVVAAVAAAALSARQLRPAIPDAEREEPDTPRFGIPVVIRLPDEPPDQPDDQR